MKPTNQHNGASSNLKSAVIAGITAFVIYFAITLLITGFSSDVLLMGLLVGLATFVVAWLVTTLMARRRKD